MGFKHSARKRPLGFKNSNIAVLIAEQNAGLTGSVADRIYVLQTARVRYHDVPDLLFKMPAVVESFLTV
jgi:ABC-type branched-subunit amino acid transport system ATPase component